MLGTISLRSLTIPGLFAPQPVDKGPVLGFHIVTSLRTAKTSVPAIRHPLQLRHAIPGGPQSRHTHRGIPTKVAHRITAFAAQCYVDKNPGYYDDRSFALFVSRRIASPTHTFEFKRLRFTQRLIPHMIRTGKPYYLINSDGEVVRAIIGLSSDHCLFITEPKGVLGMCRVTKYMELYRGTTLVGEDGIS